MQVLQRLKALFSNSSLLFPLVALGVLGVLVLLILIRIFTNPQQSKLSEPSPTPIRATRTPQQPAATQTLEEMKKSQSAADKAYGDTWVETLKKYPWYSKLPLRANDMFIYFDLTKKVFVAKVYPPREINDATKEEILTKLRNIGVDTTKYPIEYVVDNS
jgi:hypothetical protein